MKKGKHIVAANWKLNPETLLRAKKIFDPIKKTAGHLKNVETIIIPPAPFIAPLADSYSGKRILFGAQDILYETRGAHTGGVAASMVESVGAKYVLVGHSEKRASGDDNETVAKKVRSGLDASLNVILCVGEKERDSGGKYLEFIQAALVTALRGVTTKELRAVLIAYEPIFAIGKSAGDALTPTHIHETTLYIRRILTEMFDRDSAFRVPILYGGSVEVSNAGAILSEGAVQGFLVGHASLSPDEFSEILSIADRT